MNFVYRARLISYSFSDRYFSNDTNSSVIKEESNFVRTSPFYTFLIKLQGGESRLTADEEKPNKFQNMHTKKNSGSGFVYLMTRGIYLLTAS